MEASKVSVLYIYIKYCADVEKCGSFKGLGFIYIYIDYDGSQYKDYIYIYDVFDDKYWWVTSYEIVVRIIYLKVCSHTPMLVNSTYWVISLPYISPYRYIYDEI